MTQQAQGEKPPCYGRVDTLNDEGWNPNSVECAGGMDPTHLNERTGTNLRDRCVFFNSCGTVVQAKKMEASKQLIPSQSLVKPTLSSSGTFPYNTPPKPVPPPTPPQPPFLQRFAEQVALQEKQRQMTPQYGYPPQVPPQQVPYGYQQMMPVNYQMPGYLSQPEPLEPGGFWRMLFMTVFRSIGKSVGHSISHLFDTVPLGKTKPPPGT